MRWKKRPEIPDQARRTIRRFLLVPKLVGDEYRWLEWVHVEQVYGIRWSELRGQNVLRWHDERILDNEGDEAR